MKLKDYILISLVILLGFMLGIKSCEVNQLNDELTATPDTIYVPKPYKVEVIKEITKPVKVLVYLKDTAARAQAENQNIITRVEYVRHPFFKKKLDFLQVDKIDTAGNIFSSKYETKHLKEIKIDGDGNVHVKKRKFIGLKIAAGILTGGGLVYLIKH